MKLRSSSPVAVVAAALFLGGCSRSSGATHAQPTPNVALVDAGPHPLDAAAAVSTGRKPASFVPGTGRVSFGNCTSQNPAISVQELHVVRDEDGGTGAHFLDDADEWPASLDDAGRLRARKSALGPLDITLYDDGSFEGEQRYEDGSKSTWAAVPFVPVAAEQLREPVGFEGFLGGTIR